MTEHHDAQPKTGARPRHAIERTRSQKPSVFTDPDHYPGLTIAQPYAGAVLLAAQGYPGKTIETRKTRFLHVGAEIVICAGLDRWEDDCLRLLNELVIGRDVPKLRFYCAIGEHGVALCLATVVACRWLTCFDYQRSLWWDPVENARKPRWAWQLDKLRPIRPFPWRGSQGFSRVPRKLVEVLGA